jgi:hypothetical protein
MLLGSIGAGPRTVVADAETAVVVADVVDVGEPLPQLASTMAVRDVREARAARGEGRRTVDSSGSGRDSHRT